MKDFVNGAGAQGNAAATISVDGDKCTKRADEYLIDLEKQEDPTDFSHSFSSSPDDPHQNPAGAPVEDVVISIDLDDDTKSCCGYLGSNERRSEEKIHPLMLCGAVLLFLLSMAGFIFVMSSLKSKSL